MGLFKSKPRLADSPRDLRTGTQIPLVEVDPAFIEWARQAKPREKRLGHVVRVRVDLVGDNVEVRAGDGNVVALLDPKFVPYYVDEFKELQSRGQYGVTDACIKWDGSKSPHTLSLNWGVGGFDGGIL